MYIKILGSIIVSLGILWLSYKLAIHLNAVQAFYIICVGYIIAIIGALIESK